LVGLFDNLFPAGEQDIDFEEFKTSYLKGSALASQLAKESILATKLQQVIENKNYNDIEIAFNLYTIMREEHSLLADLGDFSMLVDTPELLRRKFDQVNAKSSKDKKKGS